MFRVQLTSDYLMSFRALFKLLDRVQLSLKMRIERCLVYLETGLCSSSGEMQITAIPTVLKYVNRPPAPRVQTRRGPLVILIPRVTDY